MKQKLYTLRLVEDIDYRLRDISEPVPQGGYSTKKVYKLTPESLKTCLLRPRRYLRDISEVKKTCTKVVKAKHVFDTIGVKEGRRSKYSMLEEIIKDVLPNAKMVKF